MNKISLKRLVLITIITVFGYYLLINSIQPIKVDYLIESILFFIIGIIGLIGYFNSSNKTNVLFKRFELLFGLTYLLVAISSFLTFFYLFNNPSIQDILVNNIRENILIKLSTSLKTISYISMLITWYYFYRFLNIKAKWSKQFKYFIFGFSMYFILSYLIYLLTYDINILILGIVVGLAIGLFTMIAQKRSTRYLSLIFFLFSCIHLWEFYLMGKGFNLYTGLNNPIYWSIIMFYGIEVYYWIKKYCE